MTQNIDNNQQKQTQDKELKGIGGWLILIAIGVIISPIRVSISLYQYYKDITPEVFSVLTTPGSELYHILWKPFLIGEFATNLFILVLSLFLVYLFFFKRQQFPKVYIALAIIVPLVLIADGLVGKIVMPNEPIFDPLTAKDLSRSIGALIIWVPYMLMSKRVKNTFVN